MAYQSFLGPVGHEINRGFGGSGSQSGNVGTFGSLLGPGGQAINDSINGTITNSPGQQGSEGNGGWLESFKNFFLGTPEGIKMIQRFTPEQRSVMSQILQGGLGQLQNPTQGFEAIAQEAKNNFKTDTIPSILQRFSTQGSNKNSSGLQGALGAAGNQLNQGLASLKAQYGLANQKNALAQTSLGLEPQFESLLKERQPGAVENAGKYLVKLLPYLI